MRYNNVQARLRSEVQAADLALAQAIALETSDALRDARDSLADLGTLPAVRAGWGPDMTAAFAAFRCAGQNHPPRAPVEQDAVGAACGAPAAAGCMG